MCIRDRSGELAQLEEKGKRQQADSESLKKLEHESYTLDKEIFEREKAFQRSGHELENLTSRQKRDVYKRQATYAQRVSQVTFKRA